VYKSRLKTGRPVRYLLFFLTFTKLYTHFKYWKLLKMFHDIESIEISKEETTDLNHINSFYLTSKSFKISNSISYKREKAIHNIVSNSGTLT
jgi:hypothetical protein